MYGCENETVRFTLLEAVFVLNSEKIFRSFWLLIQLFSACRISYYWIHWFDLEYLRVYSIFWAIFWVLLCSCAYLLYDVTALAGKMSSSKSKIVRQKISFPSPFRWLVISSGFLNREEHWNSHPWFCMDQPPSGQGLYCGHETWLEFQPSAPLEVSADCSQ